MPSPEKLPWPDKGIESVRFGGIVGQKTCHEFEMPTPENRLEFRLVDRTENLELTPDTVDLPTLRGFLSEIEDFIRGNERKALLKDSRVRIEKGSLKVLLTVPAALGRSVETDIRHLNETRDLDTLQPKRAAVLETWWERTKRYENRSYTVGWTTPRKSSLLVRRDTDWSRGSANAWVAVEKYLTGRVVDLGGKTKANVHLALPDGRGLVVEASEEILSAEEENHLYRDMTLRVLAEENLYNGEMRGLRLLEFLASTREIDSDVLTKMWERGRKLYWAQGEYVGGRRFDSVIKRSNLDGSHIETVIAFPDGGPYGYSLEVGFRPGEQEAEGDRPADVAKRPRRVCPAFFEAWGIGIP